MKNSFIIEENLPFCKGCGHTLIAENTAKALEKLGFNPLDVILVTDIGCHGIIDKSFGTHTVHGLHGRSVALAAGVSLGLNNPDKKVVVFLGDGGATIGMQHIIDAAHNGFNMSVVIHNNMLYGMTGGQPSEFTPAGFKTPTLPQGAKHDGYDICALATAAGANYASRIVGIGDFSDAMVEVFNKKGFSLIEIMEICPSYGVKSNPGMKLSKIIEEAGIPIKTYVDNEKDNYYTDIKTGEVASLLENEQILNTKYEHFLDKRYRLLIAGSAGEGVQVAAEMLVKAGMLAGLGVTKKGSYPVTVGIGFSASEVILSPDRILYTGSPQPDAVIITSEDGLAFAKKTIEGLQPDNILYIDDSLAAPKTLAQVVKHDFRNKLGARSSVLYAIAYFLQHRKPFPIEAFGEIFSAHKVSAKVKLENLLG